MRRGKGRISSRGPEESRSKGGTASRSGRNSTRTFVELVECRAERLLGLGLELLGQAVGVEDHIGGSQREPGRPVDQTAGPGRIRRRFHAVTGDPARSQSVVGAQSGRSLRIRRLTDGHANGRVGQGLGTTLERSLVDQLDGSSWVHAGEPQHEKHAVWCSCSRGRLGQGRGSTACRRGSSTRGVDDRQNEHGEPVRFCSLGRTSTIPTQRPVRL